MIICHCNKITDQEILEIAEELKNAEPDTPIRSNKIYRYRGCRAKCGCCRPMMEALLLENGYDVTVARREEIERLQVRRFQGCPPFDP